MKCEKCFYKDGVFCKRYPPTIFFVPDYTVEYVQFYPEVMDDDWCGEFKQKITHDFRESE